MASPLIQSYGSFSKGRKTQTAGTQIVILIPPFSNQGPTGLGTGQRGLGLAHITHLILDGTTTAQNIAIMRPLNFTTFSADAAAAQAVVNLTADPGVYSGGGYQYGLPNGMTAPRTGNNAIAANDNVVYQAADGTYVADTVSSVSSLAITLNTNLPTGGVKAGGLFWFYGVSGDTDPATGEVHVLFATTGAAARQDTTDPNGLWCALHPGDPLLVVDPNATAADTIQLVSGYYAKH